MTDYNFIRWDQSNWERALKFLEKNKAKNFRKKKCWNWVEEMHLYHYGQQAKEEVLFVVILLISIKIS